MPVGAVLEASSDVSFADNLETRRSTQGYLISLFSSLVAWQLTYQKSIIILTIEAELLALSIVSREIITIR